MITVVWYSVTAQFAEIWRILDLSGMTKSVRDSRNFTKSHWVYINNNPVSGLKDTVRVGDSFTLELRFPNGRIISRDIYLANQYYSTRKPRNNDPFTLHYRG